MTEIHCATPSQRLANAARHELRAKIAAQAKPDTPISCPSASKRHQVIDLPALELRPLPLPEDKFSFAKWKQRQEELHPLPKPLWFEVVEDLGPVQKAAPKIPDIQQAVCRSYNVKLRDMLSPRRGRDISFPRQVAMYLAKTLTLRSLPDIGRRFGDRDHTTILHGVRKVERLLLADETLLARVDAITHALETA